MKNIRQLNKGECDGDELSCWSKLNKGSWIVRIVHIDFTHIWWPVLYIFFISNSSLTKWEQTKEWSCRLKWLSWTIRDKSWSKTGCPTAWLESFLSGFNLVGNWSSRYPVFPADGGRHQGKSRCLCYFLRLLQRCWQIIFVFHMLLGSTQCGPTNNEWLCNLHSLCRQWNTRTPETQNSTEEFTANTNTTGGLKYQHNSSLVPPVGYAFF